MATAAVSFESERVRVPARALVHTGFRAWVTSDEFPEKGVRATFVAGEVLIEMRPESIETHNKAKAEITITLGQIVRDEDLGEVYADRAFYTNVKAHVSTEPDLMFASWSSIESGRVRFTRKANRASDAIEIVGTPDLVVEVVSDSSERKDLVLLRGGYLRARVPEYWVVDARADEVRFEILLLRGKGYVSSARRGQPQRSAVLGRRFSLMRDLNRAGRARYRLEVR